MTNPETQTETRNSRPGATCSCGKVHDRGNNTDRTNRKRAMAKRDALRCAWCAVALYPNRVEADRIVPGGRYTLANVVTSCKPCNERRDKRGDLTWQMSVARAVNPDHALSAILRATKGREPSAHLR